MQSSTSMWATIAVVVIGSFLACVTFFGRSTASSSGAAPSRSLCSSITCPRRAARPAAVSRPGHRLGSGAVRRGAASQGASGSGSCRPGSPAVSASVTTAPAAASGPSSATRAAPGNENGWKPVSRARTTSARCAATRPDIAGTLMHVISLRRASTCLRQQACRKQSVILLQCGAAPRLHHAPLVSEHRSWLVGSQVPGGHSYDITLNGPPSGARD